MEIYIKVLNIKTVVLFLIIPTLFINSCNDKTSKIDNKDTGKNEIINQNIKVTFVELGSVKCIPCKMMKPVMEDIEKEYGDQVNVVFYDVWTEEGKPYAQKYKIRIIPTQVFLDNQGKE